MPGGIQHNPARGRYPAQAREGAEYPSLNLTLDIGKHSPVDPKAGDVVADNLPDQPRLVLIGRPFAVPFQYFPFVHADPDSQGGQPDHVA